MLCRAAVLNYIGFKKRVPKVTTGSGRDGEWWSAEAAAEDIEGDTEDEEYERDEVIEVVTLVLDRDRVSPLGGSQRSVSGRGHPVREGES